MYLLIGLINVPTGSGTTDKIVKRIKDVLCDNRFFFFFLTTETGSQ